MLMPEKIDPTLLAPCGLDCAVCSRHVHSKIPCPGCRARLSEPDVYRRKCIMRACTAEQGIEHCGQCKTAPCKRLKAFEKRYFEGYGVSPLSDARFAAQFGAEALLERHRQTYACPDCGGVIDLHFGRCSACGRQFPLGKGRNVSD